MPENQGNRSTRSCFPKPTKFCGLRGNWWLNWVRAPEKGFADWLKKRVGFWKTHEKILPISTGVRFLVACRIRDHENLIII